MKKIFQLLAVVMLGMALLWSCEKDKPNINSGDDGKQTTDQGSGSGSETNPFTVAQILSNYSSSNNGKWVKGYIVGGVANTLSGSNGSAIANPETEYVFGVSNIRPSAVLIADAATETDYNKVLVVELSVNSNNFSEAPQGFRDAVSLVANPGNLGKSLAVTGEYFRYFAVPAVRNITDYKFQGDTVETPAGDVVLDETLLAAGSYDKFSAVSVSGDQVWTYSAQYGAMMSGFANESHANEDWFISPAMNLAGATSATLTFDHARGPASSMSVSTDNYTLWISTDYTSGDPNAASWTQLTIPTHGTAAWGFVSSGHIDLPQPAANTRFAFKYVCNDAESATWEIKNVKVYAVGAPAQPVLNFTSAANKNGMVNREFSHTFTVQEENLTGTTTFALTNGTLPDGLTLAGNSISGTPTTDGQTVLTITATNGEVSVNQTFTINISIEISGELVFSENFNGFSAGSTGGGASSTNIASSLDSKTQQSGWAGERVYEAGGTAKMGTAAGLGWLETPAIDLSDNGGAFTVSVKSMAWSTPSEKTTVKVYVNSTLVTPTPITDLNHDASYALKSYVFNLTGGTATTKIKFEAEEAANGRFFLEDLEIYQ